MFQFREVGFFGNMTRGFNREHGVPGPTTASATIRTARAHCAWSCQWPPAASKVPSQEQRTMHKCVVCTSDKFIVSMYCWSRIFTTTQPYCTVTNPETGDQLTTRIGIRNLHYFPDWGPVDRCTNATGHHTVLWTVPITWILRIISNASYA